MPPAVLEPEVEVDEAEDWDVDEAEHAWEADGEAVKDAELDDNVEEDEDEGDEAAAVSYSELPLATRWVRDLIGASAGMLLVGCGLALIAMAVLVPALQSQQRSAWELGVVRQQAEALAEQVHRYERFYMAVLRDDPDVLERLALSQMRLAPDGREVIGMQYLDATPAGDIDRWLRVPVPEVGRDIPAWIAQDSRLTRITRGPLRIGLLIAGAAVVLAGLSWRRV